MKKLLVPGKSAVALSQNQWLWITTGNPSGEFQYCFWDFYFMKKLVLISKTNNQPLAILSVFVTGKDDSITSRKELITKTVKQMLRMHQKRISGKNITPDMSFSLWFINPLLDELQLENEEELLRKFPCLKHNQYVILINDFDTNIALDVPDKLIEPEIVT